jgi:hypothetical protein
MRHADLRGFALSLSQAAFMVSAWKIFNIAL